MWTLFLFLNVSSLHLDTTIEFSKQNLEFNLTEGQTAVPEPVFTFTEDELVDFLNKISSEVECKLILDHNT